MEGEIDKDKHRRIPISHGLPSRPTCPSHKGGARHAVAPLEGRGGRTLRRSPHEVSFSRREPSAPRPPRAAPLRGGLSEISRPFPNSRELLPALRGEGDGENNSSAPGRRHFKTVTALEKRIKTSLHRNSLGRIYRVRY